MSLGCGGGGEAGGASADSGPGPGGSGGEGSCGDDDVFTCPEPPEPACVDATTVRTYEEGVCGEDGTCSYPPVDTPCPAMKECRNGSCVEACAPMNVSDDASDSRSPVLVAAGSDFGIVWLDISPADDWNLRFSMLDANGNAVAPPVPITSSDNVAYRAAAVWTGEAFAVAWTDVLYGSNDIFFERVAEDGSVLGTATRVTDTSTIEFAPDLAFNSADKEFLLPWRHEIPPDPAQQYSARIDGSSTIIKPANMLLAGPGGTGQPEVLWNGSGYALIFPDARDGDYETYFARFDADGEAVGVPKRVSTGAGKSLYPDAVWTGSTYGVAWMDARHGDDEIYFARLDETGELIGPELRVTQALGHSRYPSVTWTGSRYSIAWMDKRDGQNQAYAVQISESGAKLGDEVRITCGSEKSRAPQILWTGAEHALVWSEPVGGADDVFFRLFSF